MNEEKIKELLDYLASIGFKGQEFEQDIRNNINSDSPEFKVAQEIQFSKEKVQFDLQFRKDHQFNGYRLGRYTATHFDESGFKGVSRDFTPTAEGLCNSNLAFHNVSGKLDDLFEKMSRIGLENFPRIDVYSTLEEFLSGNPEQFELKCSRNEPEGFIEYIIPVSKVDDRYCIGTYKAILTPYPLIEHGVYNGIDTRELEDLMRKIDWHNDHPLFFFHVDSEPEFRPKVGDVQEQMYRLSLDLVGSDIDDKLQLKYWRDATFSEDILQQDAWDYLDSLPKIERHFPVGLEAKAAFNLLCGRAILLNNIDLQAPNTPAWIKLDFTAIDPEGNYPAEIIRGFNSTELESILENIAIPPGAFHRVIHALKRGDFTLFELPNGKQILLKANPELQTVNVYSEDMRLIPVNFHLIQIGNQRKAPNRFPMHSKESRGKILYNQTIYRAKATGMDEKDESLTRQAIDTDYLPL